VVADKQVEDGKIIMQFTKLTADEIKKRSQGKQEEQDEELNHLIGFRQVIDRIIKSKKLIVGHNLMLDLCHTYTKFIGDMPDDSAEFKKRIMDLFPLIVDTKYIASYLFEKDHFGSTHLGQLYGELCTSKYEQKLIGKDAFFG
jgi:hypothetical protein